MNILDFYRQFIGPDDLVFDIGANIGERTAIFAQLARKVIAVEPIETLRAENLTNVVFEECACGELNDMEFIYYHPDVTTLSSMSPAWIYAVNDTRRFGERDRWPCMRQVKTRTLDTLIAAYGLPAFIKIDVEGYELQVLRGLSQPVKALSFEWHPETIAAASDCLSRCYELGMDRFAISEKETFELTDWQGFFQTRARLSQYSGNVIYGDVYARTP